MDQIRAILTAEEIIERTDPRYKKESQVWSAHKDLHPQFLARPANTTSLCRLLKALNETDLDFNVRGGGCGSASARDVLITMTAFSDFEFHKGETESDAYAIVGAGLLWRDVDQKMEELAPGYVVSPPPIRHIHTTYMHIPQTNSLPP
jgi:FAD/FMN-containing dehydrogenase